MTWAEFLAQVRRELSEPDPSVWSDASILNWTNEAFAEIARRTRCMKDEVYADTVDGDVSYDLPDHTVEPLMVFVNGYEVRRESWIEYGGNDLTLTGVPTTYAVHGEPPAIYFRPTPDDAYTVRFWRTRVPDEITTDSDSIPFEDKYNRLAMDYIKARAFEQISHFDASDRFEKRYSDGLVAAMMQENREEGTHGRAATPFDRY